MIGTGASSASSRSLSVVAAVVVIALAAVLAVAISSSEVSARSTSGEPITGQPVHDRDSVEAYALSMDSSGYLLEAIPYYYELAPEAGIRPDVLVAQAIVETANGYYGGDSRPYNMAGIKKGGDVGDAPSDFERPQSAYEGVRMHVNHMAAYTGMEPVGAPHERFHDARAAQQYRGYWITNVEQLGAGTWATDSSYSPKITEHLQAMESY